MHPKDTFAWVYVRYSTVVISFEEGKYLERMQFRWPGGVIPRPEADALLFQLQQADSWAIERVRWAETEGHLVMTDCTLVRATQHA